MLDRLAYIKYMKNFNHKNKGFTLIEIMVSISIFMIIMLIALGALITFSDTAKKAQALRSAMDNVNFAMENMTRSLRMGTNYICSSSSVFSVSDYASTSNHHDCTLAGDGGSAVAFTSALATDQNSRDTGYVVAPRNDGSNTYVLKQCNLNSCVDLVSHDVDVKVLRFFVNGSNLNDHIQPSVYILMKGTVIVKGVPTEFSIQTIASQRSVE